MIKAIDADEFILFGIEQGGTAALKIASLLVASSSLNDGRLTKVIALAPDTIVSKLPISKV